MSRAINDEALDTLFRTARTQNKWQHKPVSPTLLMAVYDLMRWGPTSANVSPARFLFLVSKESKERLKPHLMPGNVDKVMTSAATVIIGYDLNFAQHLPRLFPHAPNAKDMFAEPAFAQTTAFRNSTLQGAYFILAARALGLDCGPMSGFDNAGVDKEFFPDGSVKSNFLCAVGYGDPSGVFPRSPRFSFDEVCRIL
jgi:nitroreductase